MRTPVAVLTVLFALTAAFVGVRAFVYAPSDEIDLPAAAESALEEEAGEEIEAPASKPVRLRIPTIDIDAAVQYVGVTENGNMATPNNFTDVGWYKHGTLPGQVGSAVVAGHVNNGLGLNGVFAELKQLAVGDEIFVETEDGQNLRFVVTDVHSYPYQSVPTEVLFNRNDTRRLNLVTCAGTWIPGERTYDERLIVYAQLQ